MANEAAKSVVRTMAWGMFLGLGSLGFAVASVWQWIQGDVGDAGVCIGWAIFLHLIAKANMQAAATAALKLKP